MKWWIVPLAVIFCAQSSLAAAKRIPLQERSFYSVISNGFACFRPRASVAIPGYLTGNLSRKARFSAITSTHIRQQEKKLSQALKFQRRLIGINNGTRTAVIQRQLRRATRVVKNLQVKIRKLKEISVACSVPSTLSATPVPVTNLPECSDGIDNDGDTLRDYPEDPGCVTPTWQFENDENQDREKSLGMTWASVPADSSHNLKVMVWSAILNPYSATQAASDLRARSVGERNVFIWDTHFSNSGSFALSLNPADFCTDPITNLGLPCIFWDQGAVETAIQARSFFRDVRHEGGDIENVVLDFEEIYYRLGSWGLRQCGSTNLNDPEPFRMPCDLLPARFRAIQNDPRFAELFARLSAHGFRLRNGSLYETFLASGIDRSPSDIWDAYMAEHMANYLNTAYYLPLAAEFPDARLSNWEGVSRSPAFPTVDGGGSHPYRFPFDPLVGNQQAPALYGGTVGAWSTLPLPGFPSYAVTGFNALIGDQNYLRASINAGNSPVTPWFPGEDLSTLFTNQSDPYPNKELFYENLFHTLVSGVSKIIFWNPEHSTSEEYLQITNAMERRVSNALGEFDLVAGIRGRRLLTRALADWNGDYLLTCTAARRAICRLTIRDTADALAAVAEENSEKTVFALPNGRRLEFPHGRILRVGVLPHTRAGVWIAGPLDMLERFTTQ